MFSSHSMANIFLVSLILLLFHSPKVKPREISQQKMKNAENIVLKTLR